ncbi:site-2 protease family protein, partial [Patescibacteria group bacterium]|nr:site-2 protease family protein [Patescibacteria group bacterium]
TLRYPWYIAPIQAIVQVAVFTVSIIIALWQVIVGIASGTGVSQSLSGPVGIAVMTGDAVRLGFVYVLQFAAMLSINLAILNILPFPALDGGRIIFLFVEWIKGSAVDKKVEAVAHNIGFLALMILIVLVTFRDILNLF